MPYLIKPGARLMVGPGGQLEESLGACCQPCARGQPCQGGLGAIPFIRGKGAGKDAVFGTTSQAVSAIKAANPGISHADALAAHAAGAGGSYAATAAGGIMGAIRSNKTLVLAGGAAVLILGGAFLLHRRNRRKR